MGDLLLKQWEGGDSHFGHCFGKQKKLVSVINQQYPVVITKLSKGLKEFILTESCLA